MLDTTSKLPITLAGRTFELSCLPFKKNRIVVPSADFANKALIRSNGVMNRGPDGKPDGTYKVSPEPLQVTAIDHMNVAIFEAVSHADPKVTREIYDSWPQYFPELCIALRTICKQTGVLVEVTEEAGSGAAKSGES